MIISDTMNAAVHPANGMVLDSKSSFRKVTKAHGLIEVGDQAPAKSGNFRPVTPSKNDVGRALKKVREGYRPAKLQTLTP